MRKILLLAVPLCLAMVSCGPKIDPSRVVANPVNVQYAFHRQEMPREYPAEMLARMTPEQKARMEESARRQAEVARRTNGAREAADPVCLVYHDKYYLFPSKSEGYYTSTDMQHWSHIKTSILPIDLYAPALMVYKDELYWAVSDVNVLYKTSNPDDGESWVLVTDQLMPYPERPRATAHDPELFVDDDGRVYFYFGCSNVADIRGIELDPNNNFASIGESSVSLIDHMEGTYGWERPGDKNEQEKPGWNEGATMFKYNGKYYLQYAAPGTEFETYGDGVYVSDKPLGPFIHMDDSPMSVKPGGWMTGAGHGYTFKDRYGNFWHVASCVISQRMDFERRVGFFPVFFTKKGNMYALTDFSDSPYVLPDKKVNFQKKAPWTGWRVLSADKAVTASSSLNGHPAEFATDNIIKTLWSANSGDSGEWLQIDLGKKDKVYAVQTNFADQDFGFFDPDNAKSPYRYLIEYSTDGKKWSVLFNKADNQNDNPHELLVCEKPVKARYIRITNCDKLTGKFSIFDLRVFGFAPGKAPKKVTGIQADRSGDRRNMTISWTPVPDATGYILRWSTEKDELYHACEVKDPKVSLGLFSSDTDYYFTVDAFNESGVTKGKEIIHVD
ncbi:MAG: discoidin domain-containing protein [Bacteroidales bacterium]|nr:discoidin domain-containing protein [Bacteroidales bacterium]